MFRARRLTTALGVDYETFVGELQQSTKAAE